MAAILVVGVLIAVSQAGSSGGGASTTPSGLRGLPEHGMALGNPRAPFTMVEFADPQCPFCAQYDRASLPAVVKRDVRTGRLRIDLRPLAFIGPDSERMARVVEAAGRQDRAWQLIDLIYHDQGEENSGYATDAYLRGLMARVPGLDANRVLDEAGSSTVTARLATSTREAHRNGIVSTPSFLIGRTGGRLASLSGSPDRLLGPA
jgi:protein-disulfide isomerase